MYSTAVTKTEKAISRLPSLSALPISTMFPLTTLPALLTALASRYKRSPPVLRGGVRFAREMFRKSLELDPSKAKIAFELWLLDT